MLYVYTATFSTSLQLSQRYTEAVQKKPAGKEGISHKFRVYHCIASNLVLLNLYLTLIRLIKLTIQRETFCTFASWS